MIDLTNSVELRKRLKEAKELAESLAMELENINANVVSQVCDMIDSFERLTSYIDGDTIVVSVTGPWSDSQVANLNIDIENDGVWFELEAIGWRGKYSSISTNSVGLLRVVLNDYDDIRMKEIVEQEERERLDREARKLQRDIVRRQNDAGGAL